MLSHCLKSRKTKKKPKAKSTKNGRVMLLSKYEMWEIKNENLLKNKKLVDY